MPATASRIGFITEEFRKATAGPDAGVVAKYGEQARDTPEPVESFFDNVADAALVAGERLALLSADRRRFVTEISGADTGMGLSYNQTTPTARLIDDQRAADLNCAVVEIGIDFEAGRTIATVWG